MITKTKLKKIKHEERKKNMADKENDSIKCFKHEFLGEDEQYYGLGIVDEDYAEFLLKNYCKENGYAHPDFNKMEIDDYYILALAVNEGILKFSKHQMDLNYSHLEFEDLSSNISEEDIYKIRKRTLFEEVEFPRFIYYFYLFTYITVANYDGLAYGIKNYLLKQNKNYKKEIDSCFLMSRYALSSFAYNFCIAVNYVFDVDNLMFYQGKRIAGLLKNMKDKNKDGSKKDRDDYLRNTINQMELSFFFDTHPSYLHIVSLVSFEILTMLDNFYLEKRTSEKGKNSKKITEAKKAQRKDIEKMNNITEKYTYEETKILGIILESWEDFWEDYDNE